MYIHANHIKLLTFSTSAIYANSIITKPDCGTTDKATTVSVLLPSYCYFYSETTADNTASNANTTKTNTTTNNTS